MANKSTKIAVRDVHFYLDAQRQDGIDRGSQSFRTGQVLALREKLLTLPGGEFDLAMRTLSKMVEGKEVKNETGERKSAAADLYKQARGGESSLRST